MDEIKEENKKEVPLTSEEELEIARRIWDTREVIDFPSLGGG